MRTLSRAIHVARRPVTDSNALIYETLAEYLEACLFLFVKLPSRDVQILFPRWGRLLE